MNRSRSARTPMFGLARSADGRGGFTLVELLSVIAVIAILLALIVPVFAGRNSSADLARSVYLLSGSLERARADAMARNVYRYVAVEPATDAGSAILRIKTVGSRGGGRFPDASAPLSLLDATITLSQVRLATFAEDKPPRAAAEQKLAELPTSYRLSVSGLFSNAFLFECAPGGGVSLVANAANDQHTLCHWIETGLQPIRGGTADAANYAIVQIAGLTGQTRVYRP